MAFLSQAEIDAAKKGQAASASPVTSTPETAPNQAAPNDATQSFINGGFKGLSFGLKNKIGGVEGAAGNLLRKVAPKSMVASADAAQGTQSDPKVNPLASFNAATNPIPGSFIQNLLILAGSGSKDEKLSDTYARLRDQGAQQDATNAKNHPVASVAGEVVGSLAPMFVGGGIAGKAIQGGAKLLGAGAEAADATGLVGTVSNIGKTAAGKVAMGAGKGAVTGGAYGVASEDGGDLGAKLKNGVIGTLLGVGVGGAVTSATAIPLAKSAVAGAVTQKAASVFGKAKLIGQILNHPEAVDPADAQAAIKALNDAGIPAKTIQDVQRLIHMEAAESGASANDAVTAVAKNLSAGAKPAVPATSSIPGVELNQPNIPTGSAAVARGLKNIAESAPDSTSPGTQTPGFTGKFIPNPNAADATPLPEAAKATVNKTATTTNAVGAAGTAGAESANDQAQVGDHNPDTGTVGAKPLTDQQIKDLLTSMNVNPDSPDGKQKLASINGQDNHDQNAGTDEGKPSEDVPEINIVGGVKYLTTPSGQKVKLNS